jgi:Zn-dependent protease
MSNFEISVYMLVGLVIGVIFHEFMHGYVAYRFGDMTAKRAGRLTLDPMAHVDTFGTIILPGILLLLNLLGINSFIIGYAKPVPINPFAFRRRSAIIWVSLAGPLTNLAIASFFVGLAKLVYELGGTEGGLLLKLTYMFSLIMYINVVLFVFNLIPIPPLDGSRILGFFLKGEARRAYFSVEPYGFVIILVLLSFFSMIFTTIATGVANLLMEAVRLPRIF